MSSIKEYIAKKVGNRIDLLIEKHFGGNKSRFGKLLGLDNSAVNKLINGKRHGLTFHQMYSMRSQYQIDLNDLITGEYSSGDVDQLENESHLYSLAAKKDIQRLEAEVNHLKERVSDKEDVVKSKDQIIEYLKKRIDGLLEREL